MLKMNNKASNSIHVLVRIFGRVQGVGYRHWMRKTAEKLGLAGWVKNCDDGTVMAEVSGTANQIETLIASCRIGPPNANVSNIETQQLDEPCGMPPNTFEIRR